MLQLLLEQDPIQHSDENDTAEAEQTLRDKQKLTIFQNLLLNVSLKKKIFVGLYFNL